MAKYILLIIIMLVSCSRKTTQTVTADHTEQHETASLTFDQWQVLSQAAWQSQLHTHTHTEKLTEHIIIDAKGDTVSKDITHQRDVSGTTKQGSGTVKEVSVATQTEAVKEQSIIHDRQQDSISKPTSHSITNFVIGIVVAVAFVWSFLAIHKALANK